jgi:hypothetical protein
MEQNTNINPDHTGWSATDSMQTWHQEVASQSETLPVYSLFSQESEAVSYLKQNPSGFAFRMLPANGHKYTFKESPGKVVGGVERSFAVYGASEDHLQQIWEDDQVHVGWSLTSSQYALEQVIKSIEKDVA